MKLVLLLLAICFGLQAQENEIDARVSNTTGVSTSAVSATGNISAAKFIGDGALLTGLTTSPSWYALQSIPTPVQLLSNSTSVSVTTINSQYASFSTVALSALSLSGSAVVSTTTSPGLTVRTRAGVSGVSITAINDVHSGLVFSGLTFCGNEATISTNGGDAMVINPCANLQIQANDTNGAIIPAVDDTYGLGKTGLRLNYAHFGTGNVTVSSTVYANSFSGSNAIFAWGYFNTVSGSASTLLKGFNIKAVTNTTAGIYTISFTNPAPDANYAPLVSPMRGIASVFCDLDDVISQTTTGFALRCVNVSGNLTNAGRLSVHVTD